MLLTYTGTPILSQCDSLAVQVLDHDFTPFEPIIHQVLGNDGLYFITGAYNNGQLLYYLGEDGPVLLYDAQGSISQSREIEFVTVLGGKVVFRFSRPGATQLYFADGPAGTVEFLGSAPGHILGEGDFVLNESVILLSAGEAVRALDTAGNITSLTPAGIAGYQIVSPPNMTGKVLLSSYAGIYITDGTAAGTVQIEEDFVNLSAEDIIINRGDSIFFRRDGELYLTDGTVAGTVALSTGPEWPENIGKIFNLNGGIVMIASTPETGTELWVTNGTADSIGLLQDITPGEEGTDFYSSSAGLKSAGGRLFFIHYVEEENEANDVWTSDGTVEGTTILQEDVIPGFPTTNSRPGVSAFSETGGNHAFAIVFDQDIGESNLYYFHPDNPDNGTPLATPYTNPSSFQSDVWVIDEWLYGYYPQEEETFVRLNGLTAEADVLSSGNTPLELVYRDETYLIFKYDFHSGSEDEGNLLVVELDTPGGNTRFLLDSTVDGTFLFGGEVGENSIYQFLYRDVHEQVTAGEYQLATSSLETIDVFQRTLGDPGTLNAFGQVDDWIFYTGLNDSLFVSRIGETTPTNVGVIMTEPLFLGSLDEYTFLRDDAFPTRNTYLFNRSNRSIEVFDAQISISSKLSAAAQLGNRLYFKRWNWGTDQLDLAYWEPGQDNLTSILTAPEDLNSGALELVTQGENLYFPWYTEENGLEIWTSDGTAENTHIFADLAPGMENQFTQNYVATPNAVAFASGVTEYLSWLIINGQPPTNLDINGDDRVNDLLELRDHYLIMTTFGLYSRAKEGDGSLVELLSIPVAFLDEPHLRSLQQVDDTTAVLLFDADDSWEVWSTDGITASLIEDTELDDYTETPMLAMLGNHQVFYFVLVGLHDYQLRSYDFESQTFTDHDEVTYFEPDAYPFSFFDKIVYLAEHPNFGTEIHYLGCELQETELSLKLYYDQNLNGELDPGEPGVPNQGLRLIENQGLLLFTNTDGEVHYPLIQDENYSLELLSSACWSAIGPNNPLADFTAEGAIVDFEFGLEITGDEMATDVQLFSGPTRCGFTVPFWLNVVNSGCVQDSVIVTLRLPEEVTLLESTIPYSVGSIANEYLWTLDELLPNEAVQINMELQMPNEEFVGQYIDIEVISSQVDFPATADTFLYASILSCAIDPNDKQVLPSRPEPSMSNYTQFDESLIYNIRFQNTGTDTAFTVRIEDQLSPTLDWSTFQPIAASHPYQARVSENGLATFLFENILLPDSSTNLIGSQGFVAFEIAILMDVEDFTAIENQAEIYFDFNEPIITNMVTNTAVEFLDFDNDSFFFWLDCDDRDSAINSNAIEISGNGIDEDCDGFDGPSGTSEATARRWHIYPNPTNGLLYLEKPEEYRGTSHYQLQSAQGRVLKRNVLYEEAIMLDFSNLLPGIYFLMISNDGEIDFQVEKVILY